MVSFSQTTSMGVGTAFGPDSEATISSAGGAVTSATMVDGLLVTPISFFCKRRCAVCCCDVLCCCFVVVVALLLVVVFGDFSKEQKRPPKRKLFEKD